MDGYCARAHGHVSACVRGGGGGGGGARGEEAEEERERTLILEDFRQKSSLTVCHRERDRDTEREL